jgi:hypothetical protein
MNTIRTHVRHDPPHLFVQMLASKDVTESQLEEICGEIDQAGIVIVEGYDGPQP